MAKYQDLPPLSPHGHLTAYLPPESLQFQKAETYTSALALPATPVLFLSEYIRSAPEDSGTCGQYPGKPDSFPSDCFL